MGDCNKGNYTFRDDDNRGSIIGLYKKDSMIVRNMKKPPFADATDAIDTIYYELLDKAIENDKMFILGQLTSQNGKLYNDENGDNITKQISCNDFIFMQRYNDIKTSKGELTKEDNERYIKISQNILAPTFGGKKRKSRKQKKSLKRKSRKARKSHKKRR